MKMVKSLLLGTAAGLVAMTGAQAADLPVKAKPVQYVKICSLYGAGFYYIPGTDMCLKVGGWVRAEYAYGDNGSLTSGAFNGNANSSPWGPPPGFVILVRRSNGSVLPAVVDVDRTVALVQPGQNTWVTLALPQNGGISNIDNYLSLLATATLPAG